MNKEIKTVQLNSCGKRARILVTNDFDDLMNQYQERVSLGVFKQNCIMTYCENYLDDFVPELVGKSKEYRSTVFNELFGVIALYNPQLKVNENLDDKVVLVPVAKPKRKTSKKVKKKVEDTITRESVRGLSTYLKSKVFGQDDVIDRIQECFESALVGLSDPEKPRGSFIFVGDTGTGKTMLVKELSKYFYGDKYREGMWTLNGSEYMEEHECAKILGTPAGYVGYEDGSPVLKQISEHPETIVLVDEFEKAHPKLQDVFLQVLDEGGIYDNKGERVDFSKCFIVFTSNIGTADVFRKPPIGFIDKRRDKEQCKVSVDAALRNFCRPEFIKRFDSIIVFNQLGDAEMLCIIKAELEKLSSRLSVNAIKLTWTEAAVKGLAKYIDDESTARDTNAIVKKYVTLPISGYLISDVEYEEFKLIVEKGELKVKGVKSNARRKGS